MRTLFSTAAGASLGALALLLGGGLTTLSAQQEEPVTVCVVEDDGDLVTVQAVRTPDGVFVTRDGERVLLSTAYPVRAPVYAATTTWYVGDEALVITDDNLTDEQDEALEDLQQATEDLEGGDTEDAAEHFREAAAGMNPGSFEYVTFGSTSEVAVRDIIFLGTVEGTPVYVRRADLSSPARARLQAHHTTTRDLEVILNADRALAAELARLGDPLWVVTEPAVVRSDRCLLQPLSPVRTVRRTAG